MKKYFAVAFLSLALGFGIGFGLQPAPTIVKAPVAVAPAPAPVAPAPAVLVTSVAVDSVLFESLWTAGGDDYRNAVRGLSDAYAAKMDENCVATGFDVQPAIAAYASFVPSGAEQVFVATVKKQVRAMACEKMNGARSIAILQS